jgi:AcrR family transcriptional regulator
MSLAEPTRRERKKEETRRRIFEAAIDLFRSKGFEATTVDEITEKADVGRGTFFNYFPRKDAVLAYLSEERLAIAEENATALLADATPAREKLINLFLHAASAWEQDRELSQFVFHEWLKRAFAPTADAERGWQRLVQAMIVKGCADGELRPDVDPARADAILSSVYIATLFHWLFSPDECCAQDFDLRGELRTRLGIVFDGLAPRAPEVRP